MKSCTFKDHFMQSAGKGMKLGQLILRKTVATRMSDFKARMHQNISAGAPPHADPIGGAYSAPQTP